MPEDFQDDEFIVVISEDDELEDRKLKYLVRNKTKMMLVFNLDTPGKRDSRILGPRGKDDRCVLTPEEYSSGEVQKLLAKKKLEARAVFGD